MPTATNQIILWSFWTITCILTAVFNTFSPKPFFGCSLKSRGHKWPCSHIPSFFIGYLHDFERIFQYQKFDQWWRIYSSRCILYFLQSNLLLSFSNQSKLYLNDKSLILHKNYFFLFDKFIEITLQYWCSPISLLRTFWNIFS